MSLLILTAGTSDLVNADSKNKCYSSYHLEQKLDLAVNFGDKKQNQKTQLDLTLHVKEVDTPIQFLDQNQIIHEVNVRSYIMMILPNFVKESGSVLPFGKRYNHPFMIHTNAKTGEFLKLESTEKDQATVNDYLAYYDLFQYTDTPGSYRYRNGNGFYQSDINQSERKGILTKTNSGYLNADNPLTVKKSVTSIQLESKQRDCFYYSSQGFESIKIRISKKSYVDAKATVFVISDPNLSLPPQHYFHSLGSQISSWPSFEKNRKIDRQTANKELAAMIEQLSSMIDNKPQFLKLMQSKKDIWPFLEEYLADNSIELSLIGKIFWALDRIDSTGSVSTLTKIVINSPSKKITYKAIMALLSTSAGLDSESLDILKNHVLEMTQSGHYSENSLLLVRAIGLMAKRRNFSSPIQSLELKEFIYQQANMAEGMLYASLLKSIGGLGEGIDEQGISILMSGLNDSNDNIVQASLIGLEKIPYNVQYSTQFVTQLKAETNSKTKHRLIALLGNTSSSDDKVKKQLLSIVGNSTDLNDRKMSLASLKKIDYHFQVEELDILKNRLRVESDKTNQKFLASLILKAKRNNKM